MGAEWNALLEEWLSRTPKRSSPVRKRLETHLRAIYSKFSRGHYKHLLFLQHLLWQPSHKIPPLQRTKTQAKKKYKTLLFYVCKFQTKTVNILRRMLQSHSEWFVLCAGGKNAYKQLIGFYSLLKVWALYDRSFSLGACPAIQSIR